MPDPASHTPTNRELRLHCAAVLYFLSRAVAVAFVFAVPASYFLRGRVEVSLAAGGSALVTLLFALYYFAAKGLLCAACHNPVLMDNGNRKHARAKRIPGLSHRARVAWDILVCTNFQCMYCHTRCRCKKSWDGAKADNGTDRPAFRINGTEDAFQDSPFSQADGLSGELASPGPLPVVNSSPFGSSSNQEAASSLFPGSGVPGERTAPTPITGPVAHTASVRFAALSSVERASGAGGSAPDRSSTKPSSPVPWNFPAPAETPAQDNTMNRPSTENPQTPAGANPFLAAAAMPPSLHPLFPPVPQPVPAQAETPSPFHQEFPFNSSAAPVSDGAAPWTLPSMPVTPYATTVPAWPAAPVAEPAALQAPVIISGAAAPVELSSPGLLQEVIATLEAGQRALTDAFQSILLKLEASVLASRQGQIAEGSSLVQAEPSPLLSAQPEPVLPPPMEPPVMPATPEPVAPPRETTAIVTLPAMQTRGAKTAPVLETGTHPESPVTTPRRRFARPAGLAAQQLSSALHEVFEPAPPPLAMSVPNGEHPALPEPVLPPVPLPVSPFDAAPAPPLPRVPLAASPFDAPPAPSLMPRVPPPASPFDAMPAHLPPPRPQVPAPETEYSPFAVSSTPLASPDGMPGEPVPFTFLKNNGDHFVPDEAAPPGSTYDPLDDTVLPWMQPLTNRPARN